MVKVIISKKNENLNINKILLENLESFNDMVYINEGLKDYKNETISILDETFFKMKGIISKDYNVWFNQDISDTKNLILLDNQNKLLAISNSFYNNFLENSFEDLLSFTEFVKNVKDKGFVVEDKEFIKINLVGNEYKMFVEINKNNENNEKKENYQEINNNEEEVDEEEKYSEKFKTEDEDNINNDYTEEVEEDTSPQGLGMNFSLNINDDVESINDEER